MKVGVGVMGDNLMEDGGSQVSHSPRNKKTHISPRIFIWNWRYQCGFMIFSKYR